MSTAKPLTKADAVRRMMRTLERLPVRDRARVIALMQELQEELAPEPTHATAIRADATTRRS